MGVYRGNEYTGGDDIKKIKSYLLMLNEELRYIFSNLDPEENYSEDALSSTPFAYSSAPTTLQME